MITIHTFEIEDIVDICGDTESVQLMDRSTANYLTALVNNLIDQSEAEAESDWTQLHLLIAEYDGMQSAFTLLASDSQFGVVQELQPIIIESLKKQGIL